MVLLLGSVQLGLIEFFLIDSQGSKSDKISKKGLVLISDAFLVLVERTLNLLSKYLIKMRSESERIRNVKAFELSFNKGLAFIKGCNNLIGGVQTKNGGFFHMITCMFD
jgi:hypothetical protein